MATKSKGYMEFLEKVKIDFVFLLCFLTRMIDMGTEVRGLGVVASHAPVSQSRIAHDLQVA